MILKANFKPVYRSVSWFFLIWKFRSFILIFLLFFAGVVKSTAFWMLLLLFKWLDISKLQFDAKVWLLYFNLFKIAVAVCKKPWIWQLLLKIEEKWAKKSTVFRLKCWLVWTAEWLELGKWFQPLTACYIVHCAQWTFHKKC